MHNVYPGKAQAWVSGGRELIWNPWVPTVGPTGGRNVITGIVLRATSQLDVSVAQMDGEDRARLFLNAAVSDVAGERYRLPGEAWRIFNHLLIGTRYQPEGADLAVANNQAIEDGLYLPFAKPKMRRPYDFAWQAEDFSTLKITTPSVADLSLGSSVVGIDSIVYTPFALTREESGYEFKVRDVIREVQMESSTQGTIEIAGARVAELVAYASGQGGGLTMAAWNSHTIEPLNMSTLTEDDWAFLHKLFHGVADCSATTPSAEIVFDNVNQDRARVVWEHPRDAKITDLPVVKGSLTIRVSGGVSNSRVIVRTVERKSEETLRRAAARRGGSLQGKLRVKTAGKSKRDPSQWSASALDFMPLSLPDQHDE